MAEEKGESVSTALGRAIRRLLEWDKLAERAGLVVVSSVTLGKLLDSQEMKDAEALGEAVGTDVLLPFIMSIYGEVTMSTALETIGLLSRYMGRFEFHYTTEGPKSVLTIRHAGGSKWSAFYLGVTNSVFAKTLGLHYKSSMTEELASLEFDTAGTARGGI